MPLLSYFDCENFRGMLMPRAMGGNLEEATGNPALSDPVAFAKLLYRLFKGVQHLHSRQILHGDIKPANVVFREEGLSDAHPWIIDFGHATDLTACGTCNCRRMSCSFSGPEVLGSQPHALPSDIWALGATVYFVVERRKLLRETHVELRCEEAAHLSVAFAGDGWRRYPTSLQALLTGMLRQDPEERMTISDCLRHPFFTEVLGEDWIAKENGGARLVNGGLASGSDACTMSGGDQVYR
jgi:serine/threonine protein kinase